MRELPDEIGISHGKFELPFVLVAAFVIFVLIDIFSNWYLAHPDAPNEGYRGIRYKWELLAKTDRTYDWLILGDSSAARVVPQVIESELGGTAMNFGLIGSLLLVNDSWMLEAYIEKHGAPENVLIVHVYDIWPRAINTRLISSLTVIPLEWGFWERFGINLNFNLRNTLELLSRKYVSLFSRDQSIRFLMESFLLGRMGVADLLSPILTSREIDFPIDYDGGAQDLEHNADLVEGDIQAHRRWLTNRDGRFNISTPNLQALERIVELAERYKFNVYIANGPIYEGLTSMPQFQNYYDAYSERVREIVSQSEYVHLLLADAPLSYSLMEMSTSVDHVIFPAAERYTRDVVNAIRSSE